MAAVPIKLVLWTGRKHSGKTTRALDLVEKARQAGFNVAGLLAPSLYRNGQLTGFDAFDLRHKSRTPLSRYNDEGAETGLFLFNSEGLELGQHALSEAATKYADLVIVDEFGPLELDGRMWRKDVDLLLSYSNSVILLIVRQELVEAVHNLYSDVPCQEFAANEPESVDKVINLLKNYRRLRLVVK